MSHTGHGGFKSRPGTPPNPPPPHPPKSLAFKFIPAKGGGRPWTPPSTLNQLKIWVLGNFFQENSLRLRQVSKSV